jgi:hypothetical protein
MLIAKLVVEQPCSTGRGDINHRKMPATNNANAPTLARAMNRGQCLLGKGLCGGATVMFSICPLLLYAAVTNIRPLLRDLGFARVTISTSPYSAVRKFISRSTENPSS